MKYMNFFLLNVILVLFLSCTSKNNSEKKLRDSATVVRQEIKIDSSKDKVLGTWISHSKSYFRIIEIRDSLNATVYDFEHWRPSYDTIKKERFAYYKSDGKIDNWNQYSMSIQTNKFRFHYQIAKDSLFQMAEPGRIDTLIRVYNDSTIER